MNPIQQAVVFLVETAFTLYIYAVLLRLMLQWVRADFYNPLSQFIVKVTNPTVIPLRRIIPSIGGMDTASIFILLALVVTEIFILRLMLGLPFGPGSIVVLAIAELLSKIMWLYIICILIQVVISWVNPGSYNPFIGVLYSITAPIMRPAQRLVPPVGGFDLSPMVVMIAIALINILFIAPLGRYAETLALSGM